MPLGHEVFGRFSQFFPRVSTETIGKVRRHRFLRASQETPNRSVEIFSFDVPEGHIKNAMVAEGMGPVI
jgi:hypothetical protein